MALYGYCRVSQSDQQHRLQIDAILAAGVPELNIATEVVSGAAKDKPVLAALLDRLQAGESLYLWKVDRLGRTVLEALQIIRDLDERGVRIVITTLGVDLQTPAGRLVLGMMLQIAEFERDLIVERTNAGLAAARKRGVKLGRRHSLTAHQRAEARRLSQVEEMSHGQIAKLMGTSRATVQRAVASQ